MGIFRRFALRSLAANRTRTAVSIAGIALSCALICAVLTSAASMMDMLYQRTTADEGAWQFEFSGLTEQVYDRLVSCSNVADHVEVAELGTISLGEDNAGDFGSYLYCKTWPQALSGQAGILAAPRMESGRAPEAPGEVALPHYLEGADLAPCGIETEGPIQLGSQVRLDLGTRTVTDAETGETYTATSQYGNLIIDGERYETDLGSLDVTVVGFYRAYGYSSTTSLQGDSAYVYDDGSALTRALTDGLEATTAFSAVTLRDPKLHEETYAEVSGTDEVGMAWHSSLLRWIGINDGSAIWDTLYGIAGTLAVVVMVAGISLVYNSFAISVAERTRQFGLLSSLGASKRQLRRSVLTEALILGAIGIPAGLVLGIAGCQAVFMLVGDGLQSMFGMVDGAAMGVSVRVTIKPEALAVSALLAAVTLLISAWIPAIRAARVSAVDAIRQAQDVKLSGSTLRKISRAARRSATRTASGRGAQGAPAPAPLLPSDLAPKTLAAKVFGIPGHLAHRWLTRSSGKGRITVAALAVSVALIIFAGGLADTLTYASSASLKDTGDVDLLANVDATASEGHDGIVTRADGTVDAAAFTEVLGNLYEESDRIEGTTPLSYSTVYVADTILPASMLADDAAAGFGSTLADGTWTGSAYVYFLDDTTWRAYVDELGLDEDLMCDTDHPRAIALNDYPAVYVDDKYADLTPFAQPGTIEAFSYAAGPEGGFPDGIYSDDAGNPAVRYSLDDGERWVPLDQGIDQTDAIEVAALADRTPASVVTSGGATPTFFLPASAIALARTMSFATGKISYSCNGSAETASRAQDALTELAASHPELDCSFDNYAQSFQQSRLMATTINTFISSFAIICSLIAVANVFNTLSTSLILRRREFAVLRSVGMGNRAFRRMVAYECTSYAARGLIIGFALALLAIYAMYRSMELSYIGFTLTVPWSRVAVAVGIVLAVIVVSTVYALRKSRSASIVESLRADAL